MRKKKGQVWVETVIYTLIAFVMIGLVLSFARPKIEELQEKAVIERSITMMKEIDSIILDIGVPGNKRTVDVGIRKGELKIDGINDELVFEMESVYVYSEIGLEVIDGNLIILTEKTGSANIVKITRSYGTSYDLQYQESNEEKTLSKSSTSYKLSIENKGINDKIIIDFEVA